MHDLCLSHQLSYVDACHLVTKEHWFWMLHCRDFLLIKPSNTNFHQLCKDGNLFGFIYTIKKAWLDLTSLKQVQWTQRKPYPVLSPCILDARLYISNCTERGPRGDRVSSICKTISCLNVRGSLELKLEIIVQTERDTSGPQRTSKKYFPALSARVTVSYCVSDMQICNKSQRENTDGRRGEAAIHHVLRWL